MSATMPGFELVGPATLAGAVAALADRPGALPCAGGTDLIVRLRKGLSGTDMLVDLGGIPELGGIEATADGVRIGAGMRLAELEGHAALAPYGAVARAVGVVAGPTHRQMATLGGNLCLDTRCVYYNQSHWWRKANGFCLKYRGDICHVAPHGNRCRAAYSGDIAPALMVHGAEVELAGPDGSRRLALADFFREDGAAHTDLRPAEILVAAHLPPPGPDSDYRKIRVRGAVDFPLAGVAVACARKGDKAHFTIAVTGTNSRPLLVSLAGPLGPGQDEDAFFAGIAKAVQKAVSPQRTTTMQPHYRRLSIAAVAARMARRLR